MIEWIIRRSVANRFLVLTGALERMRSESATHAH